MSDSENNLKHTCSLATDSPLNQLITEMSNEEHESLLVIWPNLPHTNTQISFSITHFNLILKRCKLGLELLLSHSTNLSSSCFQHSTLPLFRNLSSYFLTHPLLPSHLHWTLWYIHQSPSLPPGCISCWHLHNSYFHHCTASPRVQCDQSCGRLCGSWMAIQHWCCECG